MLRRMIRHAGTVPAFAGPMLALLSISLALEPTAVLAQTGGGTSGTTGGASGSGGSAETDGGATDTSPTGPLPRAPTTGPQSRSPAMPPSPIPPRDTGIPPVPSAGNAEPNSPIYRRDTQPGTLTPDRDPSTSQPRIDTPPGGSGGGALGQQGDQDGGSVSGDPLIPTDPSGRPAESGSGRPTTSIGEEPDRVKRGGAAGANLDECMKLWDPSTHMTKERWKETCERLGR